MTLVATPEGPVAIEGALQRALHTTGYVSSVNGMQGAVYLDLLGIGGTESVGGITPDEFHDVPLFTTPGGTAIIRTPEQYGAHGDGFTDDSVAIQAAIDACAAAGFGIVLLQSLDYMTNQTITLKHGVQLQGQRAHRDLLVQTGSTISAGPSLTTGRVVQTEAGVNAGFGIAGLNVIGRGASMTTSLAGIELVDGTYNCTIQHVGVSGVSNSAVKMSGHPVACVIDNCILGMDSSYVTLTGPVGTLHVTGTDHTIRTCEIARGPSDTSSLAGYKKVTYSGHWRAAIYVNAGSSWFFDNVGEFGDTAYYVDTGAAFNTFISPRADFSAGHGYYVAGSDNQFVGARTLGAGLYSQYGGTAASYDGVYHATGSKRNEWTNFAFSSVTGIPVARYGWADWATGNSAEDANKLLSYNISSLDVVGDKIYQASKAVTVFPSGRGPINLRPPSRRGGAWVDTVRGIHTVSDGTWWKDIGMAVVGNLVPAYRANGQTSPDGVNNLNSQWWQAFGSSCAIAKGVYFLGTTAGRLFGTQNYTIITANATAAANGYLEVNQKLSLAADFSDFPAVAGGRVYTIGVRTTAGTTARPVFVRCRWRNSSGTNIQDDSYTVPTGGANNSTSALTTTYLQSLTAPAGAAFLDVIVKIGNGTMVNGEVHNINNLFVIAGADTDYSHP